MPLRAGYAQIFLRHAVWQAFFSALHPHNYQNNKNYEDIAGYCKASTIEDIKENNYVLTPGRYVGAEEQEDDGIPFDEKMKAITTELKAQFEESHKLEEEIKKNLEAIGYGI